MASYTELILEQGSTFNDIITMTDDNTNALINIAGYTVTSQMRKSYFSANAVNVTCTITDAANGQITLSITAANTANIYPGRYIFDVKTQTPANVVSRLIEGIIHVTPQISR